jgi:hypothetical protein
VSEDRISKTVELVIAQSNDLWPLALGLTVTSFLILAQHRPPEAPRGAIVAFWLVIVLGILALCAGYMLKGSVIQQMSEKGELELSRSAGWSLIQVGSLALAAIIFGVTFLRNRTFCAQALQKLFGK